MGHIAINCPNSKGQVRKGKYKRHHAHAAEDDEPDHEKTKEEDSSEEYVLISALTGTVTHGSGTWLINSGASKHDWLQGIFLRSSSERFTSQGEAR
jgi:hypothetical protein